MDKFLREETESERFYLEHPNEPSPKYKSMVHKSIKGKEVLQFQVPELHEDEVHIRKDSRYSQVPDYVHTNINFNYIYSGICCYTIDDQSIILHKGDVCFFDRDVIRHKERIGKNDIVINCSMSNDFFTGSLMNHVKDQSMIASFLLHAISGSKNHDNYLIFRTRDSNEIALLFQKLLLEYYDRKLYRNDMIQGYLSLIIMELLRLYSANEGEHLIQLSSDDGDNLLGILYYIEQNYKHCTLAKLAKEYGYHTKYLSTLIHKKTGRTFKQIQLEQRLKVACSCLKNTTDSVQQIADEVGMRNMNYFYKQFKKIYHCTPKEYREQYSNEA